MDFVRQLSGFYLKAQSDQRIGATHISLYMALFHMSSARDGGKPGLTSMGSGTGNEVDRIKVRTDEPIAITRTQLMPIAKISGRGTYHKCMKDLAAYGYIKYQPSPRPFSKSLVWIVMLD